MGSLRFLLQCIFWLSVMLVVYGYVIYPPLIWCLSRLFGKAVTGTISSSSPAGLPVLAVLIAAHNEEDVIEPRIRNALSIDYPAEKLSVVIGSDGSSDSTNERVRRVEDRRVQLLDFTVRRGKASVLNSAMEKLTADIVLMSDANTDIDVAAAKRLVRWFEDPSVGVVCGRLILTDPRTGRNVDSAYWKYETFLKICEGRLGALLGANGAIYAIRRELYTPIPAGTIVDDFVIPLLARLRTGCQIVFDVEAIATEETPAGVGAEFHRRSRIGAGGFQSLAMLWPLLNPYQGWVSFSLWSHKILRWTCPLFMIAALLSSLALVRYPFYCGMLIAQLAFYLISLMPLLAPNNVPIPKPFRLATMFTTMNLGLLVGFFRWARGSQGGVWRRTVRASVAQGAPR